MVFFGERERVGDGSRRSREVGLLLPGGHLVGDQVQGVGELSVLGDGLEPTGGVWCSGLTVGRASARSRRSADLPQPAPTRVPWRSLRLSSHWERDR